MPVTDFSELADAFDTFQERHNARLNELEDRINRNAVAAARSGPASRDIVPEELKHFQDYLRTGRVDAMTAGDDTAGGYLVSASLERSIERVLRDISPIREMVEPRQISGDAHEVIFAVSGAVSEWVAETSERDETTGITYAKIRTPLNELHASPTATQALLDMSDFDVEGFLKTDIGEDLAEQEGTAFVSGDGVLRPRGFLTMNIVSTPDSSRAFGDLQYIATGHASQLTADAIRTMPLKLNPKYRRGAAWLMNRETGADVALMKDGNGRYIWGNGDLGSGTPDMLAGYPVRYSEDMPDVDADAYPIAFGNWQRGYTVVDHKTGLRVLRDPYTSKGRVTFYSTRRVGGGIRDSRAIKVLKVAAS